MLKSIDGNECLIDSSNLINVDPLIYLNQNVSTSLNYLSKPFSIGIVPGDDFSTMTAGDLTPSQVTSINYMKNEGLEYNEAYLRKIAERYALEYQRVLPSELEEKGILLWDSDDGSALVNLNNRFRRYGVKYKNARIINERLVVDLKEFINFFYGDSSTTTIWKESDSKLPNIVQLALMMQVDRWFDANEIGSMKDMENAELKANEIRKKQGSHPNVLALKSRVFDSYGFDGLEVINKLEVIDDDLQKKALLDGSITKHEWIELRNVAVTTYDVLRLSIYMKGSKKPGSIYLGEANRDLPVDDSEYNSLSFTEEAGMFPILIGSYDYCGALMTGGFLCGQKDAAQHMAYFLDNQGGTYYIDFGRMNQEDTESISNKEDEINELEEAAELLCLPGKTTTIVSVLEKKGLSTKMSKEGQWIDPGTNWGNGIGNYRTWTTAIVKVEKGEDNKINYSMVMSYNIKDNYRWYMFEDGEVIKESIFHLLHLAGWAREYTIEGSDVFVKNWSN